MSRSAALSRSRLSAAMLIAAAALFAAPASAEPCQTNCLPKGNMRVTIGGDGLFERERSFLVYVPPGYTGDKPVPLLLDLHGFSKDAVHQRSVSGQRAEAKNRTFIAVWPEGLNNSWNAYRCCGLSETLKTDDVAFLRAVVQEVKNRANIAADRVYITGLSNGASMAQRMACEATGLFKAVSAVSFPLATRDCAPSRPVEVFNVASEDDRVVPYGGGLLIADGTPSLVPSAREGLERWRDAQHCSHPLPTASPEGARIEGYAGCEGDVRVRLATVPGGEHIPYQTARIGNETIAHYLWDHVFEPK